MKNRQIGYSITEVLVSILLLTTGVLGTIQLQVAAARTTQQSSYQTLALQLAADIADSVRVIASRAGSPHATSMLLDVDYTSSPGEPRISSITCHFTSCNADEFAAAELDEWKTRLSEHFPEARLRVCHDDNPWDDAAHEYKWDCSGATPGGAIVIKIGWKLKNPDGSYVEDESGFPPSVVVPVGSV